MSKRDYEGKRDFSGTPEPPWKARKSRGKPIFVLQEHDASQHHFDFRLEVNGALRSWAVPKGPSTDPRKKRLAIPTEDHPLDYAGFEGVIPEGRYGAGAVLVWDTGPYDNISELDGKAVSLEEALDRGHAAIRLHGTKLTGAYVLQRIRGVDDPAWLLIKADDDGADARRNPVSTERESVLSGRTLRQIAREDAEKA